MKTLYSIGLCLALCNGACVSEDVVEEAVEVDLSLHPVRMTDDNYWKIYTRSTLPTLIVFFDSSDSSDQSQLVKENAQYWHDHLNGMVQVVVCDLSVSNEDTVKIQHASWVRRLTTRMPLYVGHVLEGEDLLRVFDLDEVTQRKNVEGAMAQYFFAEAIDVFRERF